MRTFTICRVRTIESIQFGAKSDALYVIRQAAAHLIELRKPLWDLHHLTTDQVFHACKNENIVTGYLESSPVAAMLLSYHDPKFWPTIPPNEAGFIHKLSVVPEYQGRGVAAQMIDFAKGEVKGKEIFWLRLDCHSEIEKLRRFYEKLGFKRVREGVVDTHPTTFYEMKLLC